MMVVSRAAWAIGGLLLAVLVLQPRGANALEPGGPEDTVRRYLEALKGGKFEEAYDLVSAAMRRGKDKATWAREQRAGMAFADVKIFDFTVYPGRVEGGKARVPNVLSSQDRFINQLGLTEHELYTLVREDGAWRIDQQVIVEPGDIPKWFPRRGERATEPGSH
jgi:hypothetical protein